MVHLPGTPPGKTLAAARLDRAGGRRPHRARRVGVARARAHPARRLVRHAGQQRRLRRLPHEFDRSARATTSVLVSARDTSAVYEIDQRSGRIVWTLGGKASSFRLGAGARFYFQHDAQMLAGDGSACSTTRPGRRSKRAGLARADPRARLRRRTARLVRAVPPRGADTLAESEGSVQTLPNGNVFVGFGSAPFFSEFSAGGRAACSTRACRSTTAATACTASRGARRRGRVPPRRRSATPTAPCRVYASWNGATTVARWQVLAGSSATAHADRDSAGRRLRDTDQLSSSATPFAVRALSASGRVAGDLAPGERSMTRRARRFAGRTRR